MKTFLPLSQAIQPIDCVLQKEWDIDRALHEIRKTSSDQDIIYFYVVDPARRLSGVVSTRDLLLNKPQTKISEVMRKSVLSLSNTESTNKALEKLTEHRLLALPIVDGKKRLLGMFTVSKYMENRSHLYSHRYREDVFQILGVKVEEGKMRTPWKAYRSRMPWLFCNMAGGVGCAFITHQFSDFLMEVVLLVLFIPLVLTLAESISMQSMTQSIQFLHQEKIAWKKWLFRGFQEAKTLLLIALTSSLVILCAALLFQKGFMPSLAISLGIFLSMVISGCLGALIPTFLHAYQLDPKVAAGPVVLMFTDVLTTAIYLGMAFLVLKQWL